MIVTVELDLRTPEGRAALRAWMDTTESAVNVPAAPQAAVDMSAAPQPVTISASALDRIWQDGFVKGGQAAEPAARRGTLETCATPKATSYIPETPFGCITAPDPQDDPEFEPDFEGDIEGDFIGDDPGPVPIEEAPALAPVDVMDVAAVEDEDPAPLDPERPWTPELKAQVWADYLDGIKPIDLAQIHELRLQRVMSFVNNVKAKRIATPDVGSRALAVVPQTPAPEAMRRPPVVDESWRAQQIERLRQAEREKVIARAVQP